MSIDPAPPRGILDLPPELVTLIAIELVKHKDDPIGGPEIGYRQGLGSLSSLNTTCRQMWEMTLEQLWGIVRFDTWTRRPREIPERCRPYLKCVSLLHRHKRRLRSGVDSKNFGCPGVNSVSAFFSEEYRLDDEALVDRGWVLDVRIPNQQYFDLLIPEIRGLITTGLRDFGPIERSYGQRIVALRILEIAKDCSPAQLSKLAEALPTYDWDVSRFLDVYYPLVKQKTAAAETMQLRNLVSLIQHPSNMVIINLYSPGFDFLDLTLKIIQLLPDLDESIRADWSIELDSDAESSSSILSYDPTDPYFSFVCHHPRCIRLCDRRLIPEIWALLEKRGFWRLKVEVYCQMHDDKEILCWDCNAPPTMGEYQEEYTGTPIPHPVNPGPFPTWDVGESRDNLSYFHGEDTSYNYVKQEDSDDDGDMGEPEIYMTEPIPIIGDEPSSGPDEGGYKLREDYEIMPMIQAEAAGPSRAPM